LGNQNPSRFKGDGFNEFSRVAHKPVACKALFIGCFNVSHCASSTISLIPSRIRAFITFFPAMVLTFAIFDIGLTLFNGLKVCQEVVLKQADDAMYQIKEAGRNQIRFYGEKG
jgi:GGDEF domain-containing protein